MIVAQRKNIPELLSIVEKHRKVLLLGCGTCVTVCLAGGQREVSIIASALRMAAKLKNRALEVEELTIERQCDNVLPRTGRRGGQEHRRRAVTRLRCGRAGPGGTIQRQTGLCRTRHRVHRHSGGTGRVGGKMRRLRPVRAASLRWNLSHHPVRQENDERPVQRLPRRSLRSQRRPSLRLAIDLQTPQRNWPIGPVKRNQAPQELAPKPVRRVPDNHPRRPQSIKSPATWRLSIEAPAKEEASRGVAPRDLCPLRGRTIIREDQAGNTIIVNGKRSIVTSD